MDNRQPDNGNDIDFERLAQAVREVNATWDEERDGPILRFERDGLGLASADTSQEDPFAEWYARQLETRQVLSQQAAQERYTHWLIEQANLRGPNQALPPYSPYPGGAIPMPAMPPAPAPYFAEAQHRLDIIDEKIKAQKKLIWLQVGLLVIWVVLQAISILQRAGKLG